MYTPSMIARVNPDMTISFAYFRLAGGPEVSGPLLREKYSTDSLVAGLLLGMEVMTAEDPDDLYSQAAELEADFCYLFDATFSEPGEWTCQDTYEHLDVTF